jgi:hypothetical protein
LKLPSPTPLRPGLPPGHDPHLVTCGLMTPTGSAPLVMGAVEEMQVEAMLVEAMTPEVGSVTPDIVRP